VNVGKQIRQKLLVLCSSDPNLHSRVVAWAEYDGTGRTRQTTGQEEEPPYPSIVAAMQDGWRVIQFPQQFPSYPGMEYTTSYLRYEYVLEKLEEIDV
jgi:hypothetical protein